MILVAAFRPRQVSPCQKNRIGQFEYLRLSLRVRQIRIRRLQFGFSMAQALIGKVALVTGASRGIGRAISVALGDEGATVVLAARAVEKLEGTAEQVGKAGGQAQIVVTDLTDEDSIKNLVEVVRENYGKLDVLVNNAGVTHSAKF